MYAKDRSNILDRREMLRVKLKSLAEEARIIRREEQRTHGALRDELHLHRVKDVRAESRATHLAYGLIRGVALHEMEPSVDLRASPRDWDRIISMLKKYGPKGYAHVVQVALGEEFKAKHTTQGAFVAPYISTVWMREAA